MFPSSIYKPDRKTCSPVIHRGYSPGLNSYRPVPRLPEALLTPLKQSTDTPSSDFACQLLLQIRRIDPAFTFKPLDSPEFQTLSCLTRAVDSIIASQKKLSLGSLSELDISQYLKEDLERSKLTSKNLQKYETLLRKKDEKLEEEKQKLRTEKIALNELEEKLRRASVSFESEEKAWGENKKYETAKIRAEREEAEMKIKEVKELKERIDKKVDETTRHLKLEKDSLLQLENCLSQTKATLAAEQKKISLEKLEIEKEKWKLKQRQRKIEENEMLLNARQDYLEQEKMSVENERLNLQNRKNDETGKLGQSFRFEDWGEKLVSDFESKGLELEEREKEIEQAYKELQEQMDSFNRELEERELILDERESLIEQQEKDIKKKLADFQLIENSLIESKAQIDDLRTCTLPEIEKQSNYSKSILKELADKKIEIENIIENLNNYLSLFSVKNSSSATQEDSPGSSKQTRITENELSELAKDLESKILKVKEREEKLEFGLLQLEKDKSEVIRAAEAVKKALEEIEIKKRKFEKRILEEKANLESQFLKIETGSKLLSAKEAEILEYKKKLDDRSQILLLKEQKLKK